MILCRSVKARARRMALMVASVPEFTRRTFSMDGTASAIISARMTSFSVEAPKLVPSRIWLSKGRLHRRGTVPQNQRPPGSQIIDIGRAVHIHDAAALPRFDKAGIAADTSESPHRAVDSSGYPFLRARKQDFRSFDSLDQLQSQAKSRPEFAFLQRSKRSTRLRIYCKSLAASLAK